MKILSNKNKATDYNSVKTKGVKTSEPEVVDIRPERAKLESVVDKAPKKRKKSLMGRLVTGVLGPEGLPGIGSYVSEEIIVPAIKNIIVDAVTSGINMVMYGDSKAGRPRNYGGPTSYNRYSSAPRPTMNYTSKYTSQQPEPMRPSDNLVRGTKQQVEDYIIVDRGNATQVLATLAENADMYGNVSIADYYDLIGVPSEYTDNNYGWVFETIARASVRPVRGGYVINFPPVDLIN